MGMTVEQYLSALQALLPPGIAWTREAEAVLTQTLLGLAAELARVDERADDLIDESDPRTTYELLTDWERVVGLPDACSGDLASREERIAAVVARLTAIGGQSIAYFTAIGESLGVPVTITEFEQFQVDRNRMGDPLRGPDWLYCFQVDGPAVPIRCFRPGENTMGEPLRVWGNDLLECVINRLKPAHTLALYTYSEAEPE